MGYDIIATPPPGSFHLKSFPGGGVLFWAVRQGIFERMMNRTLRQARILKSVMMRFDCEKLRTGHSNRGHTRIVKKNTRSHQKQGREVAQVI